MRRGCSAASGAAVAPDPPPHESAAAIGWRLEQRTASFNDQSRRRYRVSASIGFVEINWEEVQAQGIEELLSRADREMYAAKRSRGNGRAAARGQPGV